MGAILSNCALVFINVKDKVLNGQAIEGTNEFDTFSKTVAKVEEDYNSLRKIIIDENQAANLQDQVNKTNAQLETMAYQLQTNNDEGLFNVLEKVKYGDSIYLNNFSSYTFLNEHIIPKGVKIYSNKNTVFLKGKITLSGDNIIEHINFDGVMNTRGVLIKGNNVSINNCNL